MKNSARIWAVAFFVSLVPLAFLAADAFGLSVPQEEFYVYFCLGIGLLATVPIWGAAITRARMRKHRQELLALVAVLVSFGCVLIAQDNRNYWQPLAIVSVSLLSGWIQHGQIARIHSSVRNLSALLPGKASLIEGREIEHIDAGELEIGHVVLVRPGSAIPADGYVIQGQSLVSQTEITGEKEPLAKVPGDWVLAGSLNVAGRGDEHGPLTIRVSAVGQQLLVRELEASVDLENSQPAQFTVFGKVSADLLALLAIAGSMIAAGVALVLGQGVGTEFSIAISLLVAAQVAVVSTSAALGSSASSIRAAALGFLIRDRKAFEMLARINHIVFNKTGVLTHGYTTVGSIHLARNTSIGTEDELLALAASVEMGTSHELGHLIIQEAVRRGLELPQVSEIAPIPGLGVSAKFDGSLVQVGNAGMVNVSGVNMNPYDLFRVSNAYQEGTSVVFVSIDELLVGYIEFPDEVRANSQQAIVELSGKHAITVLSGDATGVVEKVTTGLGLSHFAAEVLSTRKADWIKERRASGSKVLLVADGHYDAAALSEADVALAFGAGHDVHLGSAQLIQVSQDPLAVAKLVSLSRKVQGRTLRNIVVGSAVSLALMVAGIVGLLAPVVALVGLLTSWFLTSSIVRLTK
jgi:Cu2+-exporting ATPase